MTPIIDFMAADAGSSAPAALRIADVICRTETCHCPEKWAGDALVRWPGCLIAAARADGQDCVIAARGQQPVLFRVRMGGGECPVLAIASLAYWWTLSGRPLAALAGHRFLLVLSVPG